MFRIFIAQAAGQQPGENAGQTVSGEIVDGAINGAELIINSFQTDWDQLASGTSPIYSAVVAVSGLIAVSLISFWSLGWYRKYQDEGFSSGFAAELAMPLIVIFMLSGNGFMLANTTVALKNVSVNLNRSVLSITRNGVKLQEAIRLVNNEQSFVLATQSALLECEKEPEEGIDVDGNETTPRQTCIDDTIEQANIEAREAREASGLGSSAGNLNLFQLGGEVINNLVQGFLYIILSGLAAAFQYVIQLSFLMIAYVAPIFLAISLLPFQSKPIYAWLAGWFGLTLVLISYSIVVGVAASGIVNQPSTNPLLMQLIQGIFSPILAVAIGTGGGMSVFTAFTSGVKLGLGIRR